MSMPTYGVYLTDEESAKLEKLAKAEKLKVTELIQQTMRVWIEEAMA
jgi:hypothetical protein